MTPSPAIDPASEPLASPLDPELVCLAPAPQPAFELARRWSSQWSAYTARQRALNKKNPGREQSYPEREREEADLVARARLLDPQALANHATFAVAHRASPVIIIEPLSYGLPDSDPQSRLDSLMSFPEIITTPYEQAMIAADHPDRDLAATGMALLNAGFVWSRPLQREIDRSCPNCFESALLARLERSALSQTLALGRGSPAPRL